MYMDTSEMIFRLSIALVLGALAGIDRERRGKPAGFKTFALVSLGAATFTIIAYEMMEQTKGIDGLRSDPLRLVAGIIGGIGFLGAGSIIQSHGDVEGITTAAGIWIVGAIGVACGAGFHVLALIAFTGVLLIWLVLGYIQHRWFPAIGMLADDKKSKENE